MIAALAFPLTLLLLMPPLLTACMLCAPLVPIHRLWRDIIILFNHNGLLSGRRYVKGLRFGYCHLHMVDYGAAAPCMLLI